MSYNLIYHFVYANVLQCIKMSLHDFINLIVTDLFSWYLLYQQNFGLNIIIKEYVLVISRKKYTISIFAGAGV